MTIAISLKVNDGVILATDSAATIFTPRSNNSPGGVLNVYQNAEKLFNLCEGKPVGAITWGSGSIGAASISTLMKDFRKIQKGQISDDNINIENITDKLAAYIYNDKYLPAFQAWPDNKPNIGFLVAGYSSQESFPEEWKFEILSGELVNPIKIRKKEESGIIWNGEPEAISRLILGQSPGLRSVLIDSGIDEEKVQEIIDRANQKLTTPIVIAPMPIKDAIDVAEFLVETTINYSKFSPGASTVGGPIDIAAITKHEGFKWIKRKYYYNNDLNPRKIGE